MDVLCSQPPPKKDHLRQCWYHALEALTSFIGLSVGRCFQGKSWLDLFSQLLFRCIILHAMHALCQEPKKCIKLRQSSPHFQGKVKIRFGYPWRASKILLGGLFLPPSLCWSHSARLWVIRGQCYLRVAAGSCLPNGQITQLSLHLTRNHCALMN